MGAQTSKVQILLLGLSGAGKTTILYNIRLEEAQRNFEKTNGFNYEVKKKVYFNTSFIFHMWDLSGSLFLRPMWRHFYTSLKADVIFFVIDANDRDAMPEARLEFQRLIGEPDLNDTNIVVLLNIKKESDDSRMLEAEVREELGIKGNKNLNAIKIVEVNAFTGAGLDMPLNYICRKLF